MTPSQSSDWLYGVHAVTAAMQSDTSRISELWLAKSALNKQRIAALKALAMSLHVPVHIATNTELDAMSGGARHQGVVASCKSRVALHENDLNALLAGLEQPAFLLVLDGVQDPHNLGACLRTADAAGVHAVIAPKDRATGITAVVSKVASGAAEKVPFFQVTNLARTLRQLQEQGVWITGADENGPITVFEGDFSGPVAIVLGAEGKGLRRLTQDHCDHLVAIPMAGSVASLNVSVAAGVCLFEVVRQRALGGPTGK